MNKMKTPILAIVSLAIFVSCKKDKDPVIIIPPSDGSQVVLNGIAAGEPGTSAGNSVYLDLSSDKVTPVLRAGWDLGFYGGNEFRVIINNTSSAGAKVLDKYDLNTVSAADTIGLTLAVDHADPQPEDLAFFDSMSGDLSHTVIPVVASSAASNPVVILNRGTGGGIAARPWVKLRVLQNGNGYTLQYAGIQETSFKTFNIPKNSDFNFQLVSIDNGLLAGTPEKDNWDLVWTYSVFETNFGVMVPYNFSDLIAINHLAGVEVSEKVYADATAAANAYSAFNKDSVAAAVFVADRWAIGSKWRSTMPATGAKQDRFYVIKDANGNFYKLKCVAMGIGTDGGTRGKPEFKYALIK